MQQQLNNDLTKEIYFQTSRSSGPGGQHANKTETRVTLRFNVNQSEFLTDAQQKRILHKLKKYITREGEVVISCEDTRSQQKNKEICLNHFYELIKQALRKPRKRIKTQPTRASKEKRIQDKKAHAEKKSRRKKPDR